MRLKNPHLKILTHYIKYPGMILKSSEFFFIPPFLDNAETWFRNIEYTEYACGCNMCKKQQVHRLYLVKELTKMGLLQRCTSSEFPYHILWKFLPEEAENILELKELMVQKALGTLKGSHIFRSCNSSRPRRR